MSPVEIAFSYDTTEEQRRVQHIVDHVIDVLFAIDIVITFNSQFMNTDFAIVRDRKQIACNYLTGWFTIDVISIIPFDEFF